MYKIACGIHFRVNVSISQSLAVYDSQFDPRSVIIKAVFNSYVRLSVMITVINQLYIQCKTAMHFCKVEVVIKALSYLSTHLHVLGFVCMFAPQRVLCTLFLMHQCAVETNV